MTRFNSWLHQPSTIAGLMWLSAAATAYCNGVKWHLALIGAIPGAIGVLINDHTATTAQVAQAVGPEVSRAAEAVQTAAGIPVTMAHELPAKGAL